MYSSLGVNIHIYQEHSEETRFCFLVVDEQNAHTDEQDLQSPTDTKKDMEEENKDNEKDEDTKELESLPCEFKRHSRNTSLKCQQLMRVWLHVGSERVVKYNAFHIIVSIKKARCKIVFDFWKIDDDDDAL